MLIVMEQLEGYDCLMPVFAQYDTKVPDMSDD